MNLDSVRIAHLKKSGSLNEKTSGKPVPSPVPSVDVLPTFVPEDAFCLETCQRVLWLFYDDHHSSRQMIQDGSTGFSGIELKQGVDAYCLLLRIACGLESELRGETEILGQLKQAWNSYSAKKNRQYVFLSKWMQVLFEDCKAIRTRFLQSIGAASYGSLVRKMLKHHVRSGETVVLVGAGQLAKELLPWLADFSVVIVNRNPDTASKLVTEARKNNPHLKITCAGWEALSRYPNAIFCIPSDEANDSERIVARECAPSNGLTIHMGCREADVSTIRWKKLSSFFCLDDFFRMQSECLGARQASLSEAERECQKLAESRNRGRYRSSGVSHEGVACTSQ